MVILVGASASGKTEVARALERRFSIKKAITTTSRSPRVGERDGVDYFFVSKERFQELIKEGKLIEHALYSGNYYGCGKDQAADDKAVVLEPQGLSHFLEFGDPHMVSFYLTATEETRKKRMTFRGDKPEDIERRLNNDRVDFAPENMVKTDFTIATDDREIDDIAEEVVRKYKEELARRGD